jgi:hypothetical protein
MGKRRSFFDDLMTVTSRLPWWVGVLLALVTYLGFHLVATSPDVPAPRTLEEIGASTRAGLFRTLAAFLQYVLPAGFLFGAIGSLTLRCKKKRAIELFDAGDDRIAGSGCPNCGSPLTLRTAGRGRSAGEKFYGCSRFPECRGTRPFS